MKSKAHHIQSIDDGSFTATWNKIANIIFINVKGTTEGTGSITVSLKSDTYQI